MAVKGRKLLEDILLFLLRSLNMRPINHLVGLYVALAAGTNAQGSKPEGCPTTELACHDIMNSSQCIANVVDNQKTLTKAALVACVEHEGTASSLPGAAKASLCRGELVDGQRCADACLNVVLPMPRMPYASNKCCHFRVVSPSVRVMVDSGGLGMGSCARGGSIATIGPGGKEWDNGRQRLGMIQDD